MRTLEVIRDKFNIDLGSEPPIKLNGGRFKDLTKLFWKLGFREGVEIGTCRGFFAKAIMHFNPKLHLYCIDPWVAYEGYVESREGQSVFNDNYKKTQERLAPYNVTYIQMLSMDALRQFKDNSLDFVYIDGNHTFEYVVNDIAGWSKKVRKDGIIAGHDYWTSSRDRKYIKNLTEDETIRLCQVEDAVNGWASAYKIKPWFILTGDNNPSWFWVKED